MIKKNLVYGTILALTACSVTETIAQSNTTKPRRIPSGSVIFIHPDGTGVNHWHAARIYYHGPDGIINWDRLPSMAVYRGHMNNTVIGTSNGGATTHAFGVKVDGYGSFGKNGDGNLVPPTDVFIKSLSGYNGSVMREAANAGIPVGIVNDGHIGEPGTGCFLAEVSNRNNWQEITRQIIQGRPGFPEDVKPWVVMGGGEADTLPSNSTLLHRNHNQERGQTRNATLSLRQDNLNLENDWDTQVIDGVASPANPVITGNETAHIGTDNAIVIKTRVQFEALVQALNNDPKYAPRVLGLFAYQDTFNDRNEEDLISRGFVTNDPVNHVGPVDNSNLNVRSKAGRIILFGDLPGFPGHNPPTFSEMTDVAIEILHRAAKKQKRASQRRFLLVAEPESNDNFGNNDNAAGMLQALSEADKAIGVALEYLATNRRTLVITAADSDAGGMQVTAPYRDNVDGGPVEQLGTTIPGLINTSSISSNQAINLGQFYFGYNVNPATGSPGLQSIPDGLEGRGSGNATGGSLMFLSEPDSKGRKMEFGISWAGTGDYSGGILSRAAGLNAGLLTRNFSQRFDNIDIYRMIYGTLFGRLLPYPADNDAVTR